jgi:hypothetical protein
MTPRVRVCEGLARVGQKPSRAELSLLFNALCADCVARVARVSRAHTRARRARLGAPISLPASDDVLCIDLDLRPSVLRKAKRHALHQYLCECVDEIAKASGDPDADATMLLMGFIGDDSSSTPRSHATLHQQFYGKRLSPTEIQRWSRFALGAARAPVGPDHSVVYFLSTGDPSVVKIGYSSNFAHRLRALRTASPVDPKVHLTMPGDKRIEADLRDRFKEHHIRREWFKFSPEIKAFIDAAAQRSVG